MRKLLFILMTLLFNSLLVRAGDLNYDNDSLFRSSTGYLISGNYELALAGYQKLEHNGIQTAGLYTDIGDVYFRTHKWGLAILYFEKGMQIAPLDIQLIHNRDTVLAKLDKTVRINNSSFDSAREYVFELISRLNRIAIALLIINALLLIIFSIWPAAESKLFNRRVIRVLLAVSILTIISLFAFIKIYQAQSYAIIINPKSAVNLGPSTLSKVVDTLQEGLKVEVLNKFDGWIEIKDFQGKVGWVYRDKLIETDNSKISPFVINQ